MYNLKDSTTLTNIQTKSFENYLKEVKKIPLLTNEEEYELGVNILNGCKQSIDKLVKHNLRFCISVAKQYTSNKHGIEDIVNSANIGLLTAASRFDITKGFKFISFAVWYVKKEILLHLNKDHVVKFSSIVRNNYSHIIKFIDKYEQKYGYKPSEDIVSKEFDIPKDALINSMNLYSGTIKRLNVKINDSNEDYCNLITSNDETLDTDFILKNDEIKLLTDKILNGLNTRNRYIIKNYFGINQKIPKTIDNIAKDLNLSKETIRVDINKCLNTLRENKEYYKTQVNI